MNNISVEAISLAFKKADNNNICHPTSIAYIQILLDPILQRINAATTRIDIHKVVSKMPQNTSKIVRDKMRENIIETVGDLVANETKKNTNIINNPELVISAKTTLLSYLVNEIAKITSQYVSTNHKDNNILPWDIQTAIANDPDFSLIFGLTKDKTALPITVIIGFQQHHHMFTEEFTVGLLLSLNPNIPSGTLGQNPYVDKLSIKILMFGKPFTFDFIFFEGTSRNRFHNIRNNMNHYKVNIYGYNYTFLSSEFIQGFNTGSLWINIDPHIHSKSLYKLTFNHINKYYDIIPMTF